MLDEIGIQADVPLPVGVHISRYYEDGWEGYGINLLVEYGLDPPPNDEDVERDLLLGTDLDNEDIHQIIEHLRLRGMVI